MLFAGISISTEAIYVRRLGGGGYVSLWEKSRAGSGVFRQVPTLRFFAGMVKAKYCICECAKGSSERSAGFFAFGGNCFLSSVTAGVERLSFQSKVQVAGGQNPKI